MVVCNGFGSTRDTISNWASSALWSAMGMDGSPGSEHERDSGREGYEGRLWDCRGTRMSELWSNISTKTSFLHRKPTLSQQQHWHV